jgi:hypothetical protein
MTEVSPRLDVPAAPYGPGMTPDQVDEYARSLPGCKRKGTEARPAWYVDDRLVARLVDPGELLVRAGFAERERLVASYPETFGVPPRYEKHMKVQALLSGDTDGIREAIRLAWELQRR